MFSPTSQRLGSFRVLRSILAVLLHCGLLDKVLMLFLGSVGASLPAPSAPITTGTTLTFTFHVLSSSSFICFCTRCQPLGCVVQCMLFLPTFWQGFAMPRHVLWLVIGPSLLLPQTFPEQLIFGYHLAYVLLDVLGFIQYGDLDAHQSPPSLFPAGVQSLDIGLGVEAAMH